MFKDVMNIWQKYVHEQPIASLCTLYSLYLSLIGTPMLYYDISLSGLSSIGRTQKQYVQETATWCLHCA